MQSVLKFADEQYLTAEGLSRKIDDIKVIISSVPLLGPAMAEALTGGKHLRGLLLLKTAAHYGNSRGLDLAAALEMIHTASLVIDDLTFFDDALTRRSRPALHVKFGQQTALLASAGLLTRAFKQVLNETACDDSKLKICINILMESCEKASVGQLREMKETGVSSVLKVAEEKTGALFAAAMGIGAVLAGLTCYKNDMEAGYALGTLFQMIDDVKDKEEDVERVRKTGMTLANNTSVTLSTSESSDKAFELLGVVRTKTSVPFALSLAEIMAISIGTV